MDKEKTQNVNEPLSSLYADAKTSVTKAIRNVMQAFPLPIFMFESILDGFMSDLRAEAKMELSSEYQAYKDELKQSYEMKIKEMEEQFAAEKEELIRQFESTEQAEGAQEAVTLEKRYIGDDKPEEETVGEAKGVD